jgi:CSLREA domain-containing protein
MKRIIVRCTLLIVLIIGLVYITPVRPAYASSFVVNTLADTNDGSCDNLGTGSGNQDCTLREAIVVASSGDTITFSVTGQITLGLGELVVDKDLTITGPGSSKLTVDGNNSSRIFNLYSGRTVNISGMTMTHGYADPNNVCGGGAISNDAALTMNDVVLTNNSAPAGSPATCSYPRGGAITVFNSSTGSLTISNSTISHNSTYWDGGGIYFTSDGGTIHLSNVVIDDNESTNSGAGGVYFEKGNASAVFDHVTVSNNNKDGLSQGGGIYLNTGTTTSITNSSFLSNTANEGGAIYARNATLDIQNSTFSGNSAGDDGGGLFLYDMQTNIDSSTFDGNFTAGTSNSDGGAIVNLGNGDTSALKITNSTLFGNTANHGVGGAIKNQGSGGAVTDIATTTIVNSTIVGNNASASNTGGGIFAATAGGPEISTVTLSNSIVYGNTISTGTNGENCTSQNIGATITTNNHNLFQNLANDCTAGVTDIISSAATSTIVNSLGNNGGPTKTMSLPTGSPAIDAGDDAICAAAPVNNQDQRGIMIRPYGAHCDIGAFEQGYRLFLPLILR